MPVTKPKRGSGSVTLNVALAKEERDLFHKTAEDYGMSASELFRYCFNFWHTYYRASTPRPSRALVGVEDERAAETEAKTC